ncbi:MAG TPA: 2-C-methyl-D-erythritol 4-phosphate cytidylyltransferase [Acidimicrobiales bacterium]|nr:2-C-methyl-D-erythritol 4-phosphate cytidylyltransferase [Acidimicrobiales bacterium]
MTPRVWVVVVAAGAGHRFGAAKQFVTLGGRPLVSWSVAAARPVAEGVVVVLPGDELDAGHGDLGADAVVAGGATRAASVRAGLAAVPAGAEVVAVHDGARPLAPPALFAAVVEAVAAGADGAVPGLAVADTLKRVEGGVVRATVARDGLVAVQTPQAFRAALLRRAHATGDDGATDDAALVESLGATVRVVPGDPRNIKVTTPADLELVRALAGS